MSEVVSFDDWVPRPRRVDKPSYALSTGDVVVALVGDSFLDAKACERMINYWRYAGAISPSIHVSQGSGTRMLWSHDDLERLRRIWEFREQFHSIGAGMQLSTNIVRDIWDSLVRGSSWEMRITIDNASMTSTLTAVAPRAALEQGDADEHS
jgi:hypothetical protein